MKKKELIIIGILTILLAFMDISGLPSALFINIEILDITPFYWTLMFNFIIIGVIAFFTLKYLCPNWKLGFNKKRVEKWTKKIWTSRNCCRCYIRNSILYWLKTFLIIIQQFGKF